MVSRIRDAGLQLFTTCPPSYDATAATYLRRVADAARWSEDAGCEGMLIYTDNRTVDPWLVAQTIISRTKQLSPLVAVQPVYLHPFALAKLISSLGLLHQRRVYLNLVAGGFLSDLAALHDQVSHDERYARLIEYTQLTLRLLESAPPVSFAGQFYSVTNLQFAPALDPALVPRLFISGSSDAGLAAARQLGAVAVQYPKPVTEYRAAPPADVSASGIRIGIIARQDGRDAWKAAHARFPEDRKGQITHQLAMKSSDSQWHQQLSQLGDAPLEGRQSYWMLPFENYKTFCPYLVGSYDEVADEIAQYIDTGFRTFILDEMAPDAAEWDHLGMVFERAVALVSP